MANRRELIIENTHRGLRYEDGRLTGGLDAGRYRLAKRGWLRRPRWLCGGHRTLARSVVDARRRGSEQVERVQLDADRVGGLAGAADPGGGVQGGGECRTRPARHPDDHPLLTVLCGIIG